MQKQPSWNLVVWVFVMGIAAGMAITFAMAKPALDRGAAMVATMSAEIEDLHSEGTILTEPVASLQACPGIPLLNGVARLSLNTASTVLPQRAARWYIPLKVQPIFYGVADTARVVYVDNKTHHSTVQIPTPANAIQQIVSAQ